jgi:hypothetical protein
MSLIDGAGMRLAFLPLLFALALVVGACGSSPEPQGEGPVDMRPPSAPSRSQWNNHLQAMTDKERIEFLSIMDDTGRRQWLQRNGIDVRADLNARLVRGISVDAARQRIIEKPEEVSKDGSTTMLFYSRFNTQTRTNFYLLFESDQLVSWNSYTIEKQAREKHLLEFEARLMKRFNAVLERGMGVNAIRKQAENAQADVNRVELANRDKLSSDTYKGAGKASFSDYIVAENLLYARNRNELFSWFQNRQPDKVISQTPFERHQYFMTHKDPRGNENVVIAEFVFHNGLLEAWYVYHEQ